MLLGTLGPSLLWNLLSGNGIVRAGYENKKENGAIAKRQRSRNCKSWLWKWNGFLMSLHPLTNFEIQRYYQNEPRLNGMFSRSNLTNEIKDGTYVINLDQYVDVGTHWVALFGRKKEIVYFNSFGVEHAPKEIEEFTEKKNMKANIFKIEYKQTIQ